ncbi:DNA alkylation repair protein [Dyadobacter sp. CY312]|uniref:DNA alkylation repair protein n=1 Tax=Dyadobacter sp. CY312 TaxID=2907303 RepID=UPI001F29ABC8|nr:DNA alkylation repair protein [Dyadobacter sp. CY312]MCE7042522.1 DNA alkylation repair protein [Dyadobacter sp. CY312]
MIKICAIVYSIYLPDIRKNKENILPVPVVFVVARDSMATCKIMDADSRHAEILARYMIEEKRKGARSTKDIPVEILVQLNKGVIQTANLVEWLAVDQRELLKNVLAESGRNDYLSYVLKCVDGLNKQTVNTINEAIGVGLLQQSIENTDFELLDILARHPSDLVRCWATYTIGKNNNLSINEKLKQIQAFAADKHFGVREICWMAVRESIAGNLSESLSLLSAWTNNEDENVRRFVSEATRPRGVWCAHIETLKQDPAQGLIILEPLKSDNSRYVQDSVGNWLNDASKTQPEFVKNLCASWKQQSQSKETSYIIRKALRTIGK